MFCPLVLGVVLVYSIETMQIPHDQTVSLGLSTIVSVISGFVTLIFSGYLILFRFIFSQYEKNQKIETDALKEKISQVQTESNKCSAQWKRECSDLRNENKLLDARLRAEEMATTRASADALNTNQTIKEIKEMFSLLSSKLDKVIDRQSTSNEVETRTPQHPRRTP